MNARGAGHSHSGPRVEPVLMTRESHGYLAYMLRLWQTGEDTKVWRASLENAHTGARHGFASLDALFVFLEEETDQGNMAAREESCLDSNQSLADQAL